MHANIDCCAGQPWRPSDARGPSYEDADFEERVQSVIADDKLVFQHGRRQ